MVGWDPQSGFGGIAVATAPGGECQVSELLEWFPDGLADFADEPIEALVPVRRRRLRGSKPSVRNALREFAGDHLPEWKWLQAES